MLNKIGSHATIIILAILLSLLVAAPLMIFPLVAGNAYKGINIPHFGTDSHYYLSRAKEALEGRGMGNQFLREGKDKPDPVFFYNEMILAAPFKVLGLADKINVVTLYNIYNFIGVFLLVLLIYFFVLQLSGDKLLAATAAIFAVGGYHIAYKDFFYTDFNIYGRPVLPYMSSLVFFAYLIVLVKSIKTKKLVYQVFAALFFGLLFYILFYAWTFALALNGALFLIYCFKKDFYRAKMLALISICGAILGLYNILNLFIFLDSDIGRQVTYFQWTSHTRSLVFSKIGLATFALFALFFYKKRRDENIIFIFSILATFWVVLNQQIITGRAIQYGHYHWWFIVPLAILCGLYMLWVLLEGHAWRKWLFILMLAVVFSHSALGQYRSFFTTLQGKEYEQLYQPVIAELRKDPNPGVILTADDYLAYLFTIYTDHDLFWAGAASLTAVPFSRFADALYVYMYLNKDARRDFAGYLRRIMDDKTNSSLYKSTYSFIEGFSSGLDYYDYIYNAADNKGIIGLHREQLIADLNQKYSKSASGSGVIGLLKKYGVNYIVWDRNKNPEWDLSFLKLKLLVSHNNIDLYEVIY